MHCCPSLSSAYLSLVSKILTRLASLAFGAAWKNVLFSICRTIIAIIAPKRAIRRVTTSANVNVIGIANVNVNAMSVDTAAAGTVSGRESGKEIESELVRDITTRRVATATRQPRAPTTHPQHHPRRTNLSRSSSSHTHLLRRRNVVPMTSAVVVDGTHALARTLAHARPMRSRRHIADVQHQQHRRQQPQHRANIADVSHVIRAAAHDLRRST